MSKLKIDEEQLKRLEVISDGKVTRKWLEDSARGEEDPGGLDGVSPEVAWDCLMDMLLRSRRNSHGAPEPLKLRRGALVPLKPGKPLSDKDKIRAFNRAIVKETG